MRPPPPPVWKRYTRHAAAPALLLAAAAAAWWWYASTHKPQAAPAVLYQDVPAPAGQPTALCPDTIQLSKYGAWTSTGPCAGSSASGTTPHGVYSTPSDSSRCLTYTARDTSGADSLCLALNTAAGPLRYVFRLYLAPPSTPEVSGQAVDRPPSTVHPSTRFPDKIRPAPPPLDDLRIEPLSGWQAFVARYAPWLRAAAIVLLAALLTALLGWLERRRKQPVAGPDLPARPPYVWNIEFDDRPEPEPGDTFQHILNRLRRRAAEDVWLLDLPASVRATITRAGMPSLRFRQRTRPPEYLLLIDRRHQANHRARLFESFYQAFRANDVLAERFFFDGELQVCYNEAHPHGLRLADVQHRYPYHRLLVLSDGFSLLSPTTGLPARWTTLLGRWKERALLTPQPTAEFGRRERALAELFPALLPASLQAMAFLIDELDADPGEARFDRWRERVTDAVHEPLELRGPLVPALQRYYPEPFVRWIAACAIYPNLYWDLTLWWYPRIAATPGGEAPPLSAAGILQLARLPWFVEGRMPREVRAQLVEYLETIDAGAYLRQLRRRLHDFLQRQKPPPEGSSAAEAWQMHLALNEWRSTADRKRRRQLEKEIEEKLNAGVEADFTAVQYLEKPGPLDFIVPRRWRKWVHPAGMPGLGWKPRAREALAAGLLWLSLSAGALWWPAPVEPCAGDRVAYKGATYCIDTGADQIRIYEYLIRDTLAAGKLDAADSLLSANNPYPWEGETLAYLDSLHRATARRTAIDYYRRGRNYLRSPADTLAGAPARDTACRCFTRAFELDSTDLDLRQAAFWCRGQRDTAKITYDIAAALPGLVTDAAGAPLAGLRVEALEYGLPMVTDRRGRYTLRLPKDYPRPDVTIIITSKNGMVYDTTVRVDGVKRLPAIVIYNNLPAEAPGALKGLQLVGQVLDAATGLPVEGGKVSGVCSTSIGIFSDSSVTDKDGRYALAFPWDDRYAPKATIQVSAPNGQVRFWPYVAEIPMVEIKDRDKLPDTLNIRLSRLSAPPATDPAATAPTPGAPIPDLPPMARIPGGTFMMGSNDGESDEKPPHEVTIGEFWMGKYEVTNAQFAAFLNNDSGAGKNLDEWIDLDGTYDGEKCRIMRTAGGAFTVEKGYENYPVIYVSWYGARAYCAWVSALTKQNYRLPTEAEWEYAAGNGGKHTKYSWGDDPPSGKQGGNVADETAKKRYSDWTIFDGYTDGHVYTAPVGQFDANAFGLHDMSGNVWEWCSDWYGAYSSGSQTDPTGPSSGSVRVIRGGSWSDVPQGCRVADRDYDAPGYRVNVTGFRLARTK
ncbi:MAG: SUMF1/EgtB/PvdO family nonheme iron enzyme [Saprospirales bacterium]|nr:SUMF1/EgtB/PvdO family nonheme iron enzyme [Saprospirales bacterium]